MSSASSISLHSRFRSSALSVLDSMTCVRETTPLYQFTGLDFQPSLIEPAHPIPDSLIDSSGRTTNFLPAVKIALVGEALGETEDKEKRPFRGSTGTDLRIFAKQAGFPVIPNGEFQEQTFYELPGIYFSNVVKVRPDGNDLSTLPPGALDFWTGILRAQLSAGPLRPNVIVAVGSVAFIALCGTDRYRNKGKVPSITHWRGSICESCFPSPDGRPYKVIPTFHPSFIQQSWNLRYLLIRDLRFALAESEKDDFSSLPTYHYIINPNISDVRDYTREVLRVGDKHTRECGVASERVAYTRDPWTGGPLSTYSARPSRTPYRLALDYETAPPFQRTIAFALDAKTSICIPFTRADLSPYWTARGDEEEAWRCIARILASPIPKMGQNFLTYDWFYSLYYGMPPRMMWMDTSYANRTLFPELQSKLQILTSLHTKQPYYKDEGKVDSRGFSEDGFFRYNCNDCLVLFPIADALGRQLEGTTVPSGGTPELPWTLWDTYVTRYLDLSPHLMRLSLRGVRWDEQLRSNLRELYTWITSGIQAEIDTLAGHPLNVRSTPQVQHFLYKELLMQPVYKKGKHGKNGPMTADETAIRKCIQRYPRHKQILSTILQKRGVDTRVSNVIDAWVDAEPNSTHRIRASFGMNVETGRLSSSECPIGTGRNMQNFERSSGEGVGSADLLTQAVSTRNLLIPDTPEHCFLAADLRQAEAMAVAWLANEQKLIDIFLAGGDLHTLNTRMIFGLTESAWNALPLKERKRKRYLGKKTSHAANYGMSAQRLSDSILQETEGSLLITKSEADQMLETYHSTYPRIRSSFHEWVRRQIIGRGVLHTPPPFNRRRIFFGRHTSDDTHREGYAYVPQSVVGDVASEAMKRLAALPGGGPDVCLTKHDELVVQTLPGPEMYAAYETMKTAMEIPILFTGVKADACPYPLTIPVDFSAGLRMGEMVELGEIGERDELMKMWCGIHG